MTKSLRIVNLLDQLKVQVLLYSGTLIDYQADENNCQPLLNTAIALEREKVDRLLLSLEQEAADYACSKDVAALLAPVHARIGL